jgi:hypothetical protein
MEIVAREKPKKIVQISIFCHDVHLLLNYIIRLCPLNPMFHEAQTNTCPLKNYCLIQPVIQAVGMCCGAPFPITKHPTATAVLISRLVRPVK